MEWRHTKLFWHDGIPGDVRSWPHQELAKDTHGQDLPSKAEPFESFVLMAARVLNAPS